MTGVRDSKRKMVDGLVDMHLANFKSSGAELLLGSGRFIAPKTIEVSLPDDGSRFLHGENIIISTGSRATIEPIPGLREAGPLTHIEALELDHLPEHLLIIGGGYIGLEFAQAMRRFGSKVTIIERNSRLAHREDEDVTAMLSDIFRDECIEILTNATVTGVEGKSGDRVKLHAQRNGGENAIERNHILVLTGRTPNTHNIGLLLSGGENTARWPPEVKGRAPNHGP